MEDRNWRRMCARASDDTVFQCVIPYVDDACDREQVSLVCKKWHEIDAQTRKHVTIALSYTTTPKRLSRRFHRLESLKLKGKPRAAMFNLIPEDWGGYVTSWVEEIARSFSQLNALHFRRMIVTDSDLELLARSRGTALQVLNLDMCSGFSTDGLLHICRSCRSGYFKEELHIRNVVVNSEACLLEINTMDTVAFAGNIRTLFLEESTIAEKDGKWLHALALSNKSLETLNFYLTDLRQVNFQDLELIARNCSSLVSVKISDCDILELVGFFRAAAALEEFCGGTFSVQGDGEDASNRHLRAYSAVPFPPLLCRLALTYLGENEMPILFPFAYRLRKLDLQYTLLDTEDYCVLIQRCPNLEVLEALNVIGDRGLEYLARCCKKLKRLRIERGADGHEVEDEEGVVSQRGLIALAQGCLELKHLAVYVSDITNASLECIGTNLKNLADFRMVLLDQQEKIPDLPLDRGVRFLLMNCDKLRRFALYLRPGGLTDLGLSYIGQYSPNVRWMLLGPVGESDAGLLEFSRGCPNLQKLEMRGCRFSEKALAVATLRLTSMKYLWVQGYRRSASGRDLLAMVRPFWNIELIPTIQIVVADPDGEAEVVDCPGHILAYYSLAGPRTDFPVSGSVMSFDPTSVLPP
ncbi:unnamed protein product [Ilex paraguariensis]|uniref:Coronatine-insensitive protein 1 n=1 Tax=Ilex paraguariensis TaxID=185542 RepID=A0ABC8U1I4_9AQUA